MQSIQTAVTATETTETDFIGPAENRALKTIRAVITRSPEKTLSEDSDFCPECSNSGMRIVKLAGGAYRQKAVTCSCRRERESAKALAKIPAEFGTPRLETIAPDANRHPRQQQKIEGVKRLIDENPAQSFFIYGDNGTGKSFLGWALYVRAVENGRRAIALELDTLLKQFRDYEFSKDKEVKTFPAVTADDLRNSHRKYTIFLDEISATTPTEYAAKEFFALLKAAHEGDHQMIYTCNVNPEKLQDHWSRQDEFWGNSIARRIAEYSKQVNLFR